MKPRRRRAPRGAVGCKMCGKPIVFLRSRADGEEGRPLPVNPTGVMVDLDGQRTTHGYDHQGYPVVGEIIADASRVPSPESRPLRVVKIWLRHSCDPLDRMAQAARAAAEAGR